MFTNKMTKSLFTIIFIITYNISYAGNAYLSKIPKELIPSLQKNDCMCAFIKNNTSIKDQEIFFITGAKTAFGYANGEQVNFDHITRTKKENKFVNNYKANDIEVILKSTEISLNKTCQLYPEEIYHATCYSTHIQVLKNGNKTQEINGIEMCGC